MYPDQQPDALGKNRIWNIRGEIKLNYRNLHTPQDEVRLTAYLFLGGGVCVLSTF